MNVVELLSKKQIGGKTKNVVNCLCRRIVPLSLIMDRSQMYGHVIVGFSHCGHYLLSYTEFIADIEEHEYKLHLWNFNLYQPISHLSEHALFSARDLDLILCLTPDLRHILVHGSVRKEEDFQDRRTCHVTLLPGPGRHGPTIKFQYDQLPPYPAFLAQLALQIPGCVLINTGDRLVAVHHDPTHMATHSQWFSDSPSSQESPLIDCSPSLLLPVTVLKDSHTLSSTSTRGGVWVGQTVFDVEVWTNRVLPSEINQRGLVYHCLVDYDLEFVQVCVETKVALFVMLAILEVSDNSECHDCVSVEVMGVWDVCDGVTTLKSVTKPTSVLFGHPLSPADISARAALLRAQAYLPISPQFTVKSYSNRSVFSGKSLNYIHHHLLPVSLALGKRNNN